MSKRILEVKYPKTDDLLKRFAFIDNEILQENVVITVQYISFLVSLDLGYELGGTIQSSAFKNIILLSASVAEGLINWKLHKMIEKQPDLKEKCCLRKPVYTGTRKICLDETGSEIWAARKSEQIMPLSTETKFNELIEYAKGVELFDDELVAEAHKLRKARNRVHPAGLEQVDDKYTKSHVDECFIAMGKIVNCIEKA